MIKIDKNILANKLFLIGGGVMRDNETQQIDTFLIQKTKKSIPHVVFLPTASSDLEEYIDDFTHRYTSYGSRVTTIQLVKAPPSLKEIRSAICSADLIYIGGGDAKEMHQYFKKYTVYDFIYEALCLKSIVAGLSAGAVIWGTKYINFEWDGARFNNFSVEQGVGWIPEVVWAHYDDTYSEDVKKLQINHRILSIPDRTMVYLDADGEYQTFSDVDASGFKL